MYDTAIVTRSVSEETPLCLADASGYDAHIFPTSTATPKGESLMQQTSSTCSKTRRSRFAAIITCALVPLTAPTATGAETAPTAVKNVILMLADGAGYNTWDVASMYQGRWDAGAGKSTQVYDGPTWVKFACSTHPLNTSTVPKGSGVQDPNIVYDSAKAWDRKNPYAWLLSTYTDSAAAATALCSGLKTYNNAINWSDLNRPLKPNLAETAKAAGKSVGVVTTVEWSHATPAGLSHARNVDRDNYAEIANGMLAGDDLDVIMGCGNPDYDNNGMPIQRTKREYKYVGGAETWKAIEAARLTADGTYLGFRPVSMKAEFAALASGPTPRRIVGTAQVATTLQQARQGTAEDPAADTPLNANVPDLVTMLRGAINVVDDNPRGFLLFIEGGAIDWAAHKKDACRMIEEQLAFVAAIEAAVAWIETHSNWDETLLIITADHETGLIWGPQSDTIPFDPIVDQGPHRMPKLRFNSKNHTNSLIPVYAKGIGSQWLSRLVVGIDPVYGPYVDNTGVSQVLRSAVTGVPLPVSESK